MGGDEVPTQLAGSCGSFASAPCTSLRDVQTGRSENSSRSEALLSVAVYRYFGCMGLHPIAPCAKRYIFLGW